MAAPKPKRKHSHRWKPFTVHKARCSCGRTCPWLDLIANARQEAFAEAALASYIVAGPRDIAAARVPVREISDRILTLQ